MPMTSVKYCLTRWDVLRWQLWSTVHNRVLLGFIILLAAFSAWTDINTPEMVSRPAALRAFTGSVVFLFLLLVILMLQTIVLALLLFTRKNTGLVGVHELELRDDGLMERTEVNESVHRWSGFHRVAVSGAYLYVYVTDTQVHIIPRRALGSSHEAAAFHQQIVRRIAAA